MNRQQRRRMGRSRSSGGPALSPETAAVLDEALSLHRQQRLPEALRLYEQVVRRAPHHVPSLNLAGVAAFHQDKPGKALRFLQAAVRLAPEDVEARNNLGNVLLGLGRAAAAVEQYRAALAHRPDYADAHFNLGTALTALGRLDEATEAFTQALGLAPNMHAARFERANLFKKLGRYPDALSEYDEVLRHEPAHLGALNNRAAVQRELGDPEAALESCHQALDLAPEFADAAFNQGLALQDLERLEEATAAYRHTLSLDPGYAPALLNLGYALHRLGRLDEAEEAYRKASRQWPDYAQVMANLADLLLARGEPAGARQVCEAFLDKYPGDAMALSMLAVCLQEAEDQTRLGQLLDYDRLVRPTSIATPDGFPDIASFNRALVDHLLAHPSLVEAPASNATRDGRHSGELLAGAKGPLAALEQAIERAIDNYLAALPPDLGHPFLHRRPRRRRLTLWGVALRAQGRQVAHNHPAAWLSGVYYAQLPPGLDDGTGNQDGWIEFGRPPDHYCTRHSPPTRCFRPEEGLLILFPSFQWHRTLPFTGEGLRVSFAFDVLPDNDPVA